MSRAVPRVLLAPDKFKGSLTAPRVARAVAEGVRRAAPDVEVDCLPVADGGDGTLDAAVASGFERVPVSVAGPTGLPVRTAYARRGTTAVVEMADACGLERLPDGTPAPLTASSRGLGEVMAHALDAGCRELVVGIGGSASTDGGVGMLTALGARVDAGGLTLDGLHPALAETRLVVACDVDNPLTGPDGAAAVYAPQKGASPEDVAVLEARLARWADDVAAATGADRRDEPGAGAAGGVGFGLVAVLGARLRPGIALMLDLLDFDARVRGASLVITGEGSLDAQSLRGKAPVGVSSAAARAGAPVVAVCGRNLLPADDLAAAGISAAYALLDVEPDVATCLAEPARLLGDLGERIAADHLAPVGGA